MCLCVCVCGGGGGGGSFGLTAFSRHREVDKQSSVAGVDAGLTFFVATRSPPKWVSQCSDVLREAAVNLDQIGKTAVNQQSTRPTGEISSQPAVNMTKRGKQQST